MLKNYGLYKTDFGRTVAYFPALKKITGTINSALFLCQLLYWTDKTEDGWIWKTSDEIEEETGLTYFEQKTARKTLLKLGLIREEYRRSTYLMHFRINYDKLSELWEAFSGKKMEKRTVKENPQQAPLLPEDVVGEPLPQTQTTGSPVAIPERHTDAVKKGDWLDAMIDFDKSAMGTIVKTRFEIKAKLEKRLHINADNKKWESFIVFAANREVKFNEPADKFITWAMKEGFNPIYWTPEKMKTLYPQPFVNETDVEQLDSFVEKLPERKEEEYAPIPKSLKRKQNS